MSWPTHQWPSNNLSPPGARAASDHRKEQHYLNGSSNEYEEILSHRSKRKEIWLFMVFLDLLQIRFQQTPKAFEGLPRTSQAVRLGWLGHPSNSHCHPRPHRQTMKTSLWWGPVGFFLTSRLFFFCLARLHFSIKKWSTFELVYRLRGSNRLNLMTTNSTLLNTKKNAISADALWYARGGSAIGFTCLPSLEFKLESTCGTAGHTPRWIELFLTVSELFIKL